MRAHVTAILLNVLSWPALAVDGTNLPGHDYDSFDAPSALVCRTTCGGEASCQAYTWVKPGIQGRSGRCALKNTLPATVADRCCDSGARSSITENDLRAENKINRPGMDFMNIDARDWATCENACAKEEKCLSWTFTRSAERDPARCWLKNHVARPVSDPGTVSGVKFQPPASQTD